MKKTSVGVGISVGVVGLLCAGVGAAPWLFQDQLTTVATGMVGRALGTDVRVGTAEVSFFREFPRVDVRLVDVVVNGSAPFADSEVLRADGIAVAFDLMDVIRQEYTLRSLTLDHPVIDLRVGPEGRTNYDFGDPDSAAEPGPDIALDRVVVTAGDLSWADAGAQTGIHIGTIDLRGDGLVGQDAVSFAVDGSAENLDIETVEGPMASDLALQLNGEVVYGLDNGVIQARSLTGMLNALPFVLEGSMQPEGETIRVKGTLEAPDAGVRELLSLVPPWLRGNLDSLEADGSLAIDASVDGVLDVAADRYPALELGLALTNGSARQPSLPGKVEGMSVVLAVNRAQGRLADTNIRIDQAAFRIGASRASIEGRVTQALGDPRLDLVVDAALDMGEVSRAVPVEGLQTRGTVRADVAIAGRTSAFTNGDAAAVQVEGTVAATELTVATAFVPMPVEIRSARMVLAPRVAQIQELDLTFGRSDLSGTGRIDQPIRWALQGGVLAGALDLHSDRLDLRPFQAGTEGEASEGEGVLIIPADLDLQVGYEAAVVELDTLSFTELRGAVRVAEQRLTLDETSLGIAGGRASVSGSYFAPSTDRAVVDFDLGMQRLNLGQTLSLFTSVGELLPVLMGNDGVYSGTMELAGDLGPDLVLDPRTLFSAGEIRFDSLGLSTGILGSIADRLGQPGMNRLVLDGRDATFTVNAGTLRVRPFRVQLGSVGATLSGGAGLLDKTLDLAFDVEVPSSGLAQSSLLAGLAGGGLPDKVPVRLGIVGPFDAPRLELDLVQTLKSAVGKRAGKVVDRAKAEVGEQLDAAREQAIAEAQRRADALMVEARKRADSVISAAGRQADELVAAADGNFLKEAAAKRAGKALEKQARKTADGILSAAEDRANRLVADAR